MSSDGKEFEVDEKVLMFSEVLKDRIGEGTIPIPNVNENFLSMVLEYCQIQADEEDIKKWDKNFCKDEMWGDLLEVMCLIFKFLVLFLCWGFFLA